MIPTLAIKESISCNFAMFIRNPDSQIQCTLLLFVELELVDQELAFR